MMLRIDASIASGNGSLRHTPGRSIHPRLQSGRRPRGGFVGMADIAGIGHLQCVGRARRDELEGVATHVHVVDGLFDLRHVTCDALIAGTAGLVMRVRLDGGRMRTVG